ncbi:MAG: sugar ABC transporter permease [Candidatus Omnitrophota bacterium]
MEAVISAKRKVPVLQALFQQRYSYLFIMVPFALFTIFVLLPIFASFFLSFTKYDVIHPWKWVGLENYRNIFLNDMRFRKAMLNTFIYVITTVPIGICMAVLVAVAIDQKIRFKNFFKGIFFLPTVTSIVASSVMWKWLFAGGKYGLINYFILMKLGFEPVDWLLSPSLTLPSIMIMSIWAGLGYNVILFLAGLQMIPHSIYEAAEVDGAGFWQQFFRITLPLLRPTLVFVTAMSCIFSFQVFEQIYVMANVEGKIGGVLDCALTIVPYLYDMGFHKFQMGYACALAYVIFMCVVILTLINTKFLKSRVEY